MHLKDRHTLSIFANFLLSLHHPPTLGEERTKKITFPAENGSRASVFKHSYAKLHN